MLCFNITPEFAADFKFKKSNENEEFGIKYMAAGFDKESESGELFIEFKDKVWCHKLIEAFESQGAGQVMTCTFAHNDGGDSAANALLRVLSIQAKNGSPYTRGECPPALLAKVQAKKALEDKSCSNKEFDEKTLAALKESVALQTETKAAVDQCGQSLVGVESNMQAQVVKLEGIENGVCNVIPDYQREIGELKAKLAHKTAMCDRIEGQKGALTREINKHNAEMVAMRLELAKVNAELAESKAAVPGYLETIQNLKEQVDMCKGIAILNQLIGETQYTAEVLVSALGSERVKRPRGE